MILLGFAVFALGILLQAIGTFKSMNRHPGVHADFERAALDPSRAPSLWVRMMSAMHKDPTVARWLFPAYVCIAVGIVLIIVSATAG